MNINGGKIETQAEEFFIPFSKKELADYLAGKIKSAGEKKNFKQFCTLIESIYHFMFHRTLEKMKSAYLPIDPDSNITFINKYSTVHKKDSEKILVEEIKELLRAGNYKQVPYEKLAQAFNAASPWGLDLKVDLGKFEHYSLYYKGEREERLRKKYFYFFEKEYGFDVYSRVVVIFKFREDNDEFLEHRDLIYIKLFKNVPTVDLEMLFPGTEVMIGLKDKLFIIGPLVAGIITTVYKILDYITNYHQGVRQHPVWLQIGFWTLVGGLFGVAIKSFFGYKNTVQRYLSTLATSLYIQNIDNNSGVCKYLIDDAEEEEFKELILGYYFLVTDKNVKYDSGLLKDRIEKFFMDEFNKKISFEVDDSIRKLTELKLIRKNGKYFTAVPMSRTLAELDKQWDNYFKFNK